MDFWSELDRHMFGIEIYQDDGDGPDLLPTSGHNRPPPAHVDRSDGVPNFYFRDNILDRLAEHMQLARMVRKVSFELYAHCGTIGAVLIPPLSTDEGVTARWRSGAPMSFGAVSFTPTSTLRHKSKDVWIPCSFGIFQYLEKPGYSVERTTDKVYQLVCIYYRKKLNGEVDTRPVCIDFMVCVSADGGVRALREIYNKSHVVRHRDGAVSVFPAVRRMQVAQGLIDIAKDWNKTVDDAARTLFWMLANTVEQSHGGGLRVTVIDRHGTRATFIIDMLRTPYFFADRDVVIGDTGKRKKIFHIVRTHRRLLPGGGETFVKSHFRGERKFRWGGYSIVIGLDLLHNPAPLDFNGGGILLDEDEPSPEDTISFLEAAKLISKAMVAGYQDRQRRTGQSRSSRRIAA